MPSPTPLPSSTIDPSPVTSPAPVATGGVAAGRVQVIVASTDLTLGTNRFVFGVLDRDLNPVRVAEAKASFIYLDATPQKVVSQINASFTQWPSSKAGVYVAHVSFDQSGRWGVIVQVEEERGVSSVGQSGFLVRPESSSPGIGTTAPRSLNRTTRDVGDLKELTSSPEPDLDLYQMTIAEAVSSGRPTVITFATPAFCQTATCGPQVDVVSSIKDRDGGQANFIHVEVYDNPQEMRGDFSRPGCLP